MKMKKTLMKLAVVLLCMTCSVPAMAQFNLKKAVGGAVKAAKAVTLTDEQMREYVKEYNDTADIARMFLADFFKEINSFDYLEEIPTINEQYLEQILKNVFDDKKMIISVIKKA